MSDEETPEVKSIFVKGEGGAVFKLDLPLHETIEDRLRKGYLTRVADAKGSPWVDWANNIAGLPTSRPAINAVKTEWVGWAVKNGMTPDDAEALTKQDLIEKFGATPAEPTAEELAAKAAEEAKAAEAKAAEEAAAKAAEEEAAAAAAASGGDGK